MKFVSSIFLAVATAVLISGCASQQVPEQNVFASMQQRIMELEQENGQLRGMIEENQHKLGQAQEQQKQLYIELDDRLTAVEKKKR